MMLRHRKKLVCLGACLFVLVTADLKAQDAANSRELGEIEFGPAYSSENSYRFGRYTGLQEQGFHLIGNLRIDQPADTHYWQLDARNLGLESRSILAEYGKQGLFSLSFRYEQQPYYKYDAIRSPFSGPGGGVQNLPGDWIAASTTSGMNNLFNSLDTYSVSTERQNYRGGFAWLITDSWRLNGEYRHEIKDGTDLIGAIFGTNGGNARGAILVQPIDYQTNDYTLSLAHTGSRHHFNLAWHYSGFENDHASLRWQNPFLRPAGGNTWASGTDFAAGAIGQMATDPDNQAQQFSFSGIWRAGATTQLRANVSHGRMKQDQAFLPYTTNTALLTGPASPGTDLNGRIDTLYLNIGLTTRPLRKLNLSTAYTYDDRDNETPRNLYRLVVNDSGNQGTLASSGTRINTPYSLEKHRFTFDAAWRLPAGNKLTAAYQYERINRDYTEVEWTAEHSGSIKLSSTLNAMLSGWIEYTRARRDGSTYISNQPFLDNHNPDFIATLSATNRYLNDPLLRRYTYADREQDKLAASISIIPANSVALTLGGNYAKNDYPGSQTGMQQTDENRLSVDLGYTPAKSWTAYAWMTREQMEYRQAGYQRAGVTLFPGIVRTPPPCTSCGFWNVSTEDEVYTLGAGLEWESTNSGLKLKFAYTWVDTMTDITPDADSTLVFAALPPLHTRLHGPGLTGSYPVNDKFTLRFRYLYERYREQDFALDDIDTDTLAALITNGISRPDYSGHVAGLSLLYRF